MSAGHPAGPGCIDDAITSRHSVRAFRSDPVARADIEAILEVASRAPSGANLQPWRVYVLQGASLAGLVQQVCEAHDGLRDHPERAADFREAFAYYPREWISPFIDRRRENGWGLYGLLGIGKGDKEAMHRQHQRNFRFFDAPVGLIFTMHRVLERGSLIDYGMFLQNIMIAARARGLHTCPQAAWNGYARLVLPWVGASDDETLVCGMALGHADEEATVNRFLTPREPVGAFTRWLD